MTDEEKQKKLNTLLEKIRGLPEMAIISTFANDVSDEDGEFISFGFNIRWKSDSKVVDYLDLFQSYMEDLFSEIIYIKESMPRL